MEQHGAVRDRTDARLVVVEAGGLVRICREDLLEDGTWRTDPEAGVSFGAEYKGEVLRMLKGSEPETEREAVAGILNLLGDVLDRAVAGALRGEDEVPARVVLPLLAEEIETRWARRSAASGRERT